jgi:DNA polymerase-1
MIEFDVETTGLQWYGGHRPFLAQFWDGTGEPVLLDPHTQRDEVQAWLDRGGEEGIRAWNTKFDMHMIESMGYTLPPQSSWHDGMVMAHVVDERTSVALKARAAAIFGEHSRDNEKEVKAWLTEEAKHRRAEAKETGNEFIPPNYSDVPGEIMRPYAALDCILTKEVCDTYERSMSGPLGEVYEMERGVLGALYSAERRGIPVDREAAHRFEVELAENCEQLHDKCVELAGISSFNPNSSAQIAEALERRGADLRFVTKSEKTGKPSMDAENLAAVDDELARTVERFRSEYKVLGTYVRPMLHRSWEASLKSWKEPFIADDSRIHPNFRQVGARTGRMSCSDPNIQNWPRDDLRLRYLFRAEEGKVLVTADLDAIELVLFAAFAGDGRLLRAVRSGEDMHVLAAKMMGLKDRERTGGVIESARQRGKTMNYLQVYGGGVRTIRKTFGVDQKEARVLLDRYHSAFPEVSGLQRRIEYTLQDRGYVKTPWGRRHRCWDARQEAYKFVNYLVQGSAADLLKASLVRLHDQGVPVVACVHDEIIVECDEADAAEVAQLLTEAMTDHPMIADRVPLGADAAIVKRWSDAKEPGYVPAYAKGEK